MPTGTSGRAAEEARRGAEAVERSIRDLEGQRRALWDKLLSFVRTFAPEANDPFGASAALSRPWGGRSGSPPPE